MKQLTHATGAPVVNNQNIQTAGPRGPALLQDVWLLEKLAHFNREVIPERRIHSKGAGAYGTFTVTHDITSFTKASLFADIGITTPVFVRFSTMAGERGAADLERDTRGFAIKFYTSQGNWDLVGNNTPVFFVRDPLRFPDLSHAIKREPRSGLRSAQSMWDLWTLVPEALHQVTLLMSDRGIPRSYRHMHGFGCHTFSLVNEQNTRHWVKFTLRTMQGIDNLLDEDAIAQIGVDRDQSQRDLFESIERGDFPKWRLYVQVMKEAEATALAFNPFDVTKVWPHCDYPLIEVGVLELHQNPLNYFAEVEQVAFSPANLVPGIGFSPDKVLQARLFAYADAQRYRLGSNFSHIPVNAPKCPLHSYHRDGSMRVDGNLGATLHYSPNSSGEWPEQFSVPETSMAIDATVAGHWDHRIDNDYFSQPGALFRLMSQDERHRLYENTARSMAGTSQQTQRLHVLNCSKADSAYGNGVEAALKRI